MAQEICSRCAGTGEVRTMHGFVSVATPCPKCRGGGADAFAAIRAAVAGLDGAGLPPRVVPLVVEPGYRGAPAFEHSISLRRAEPCVSCTGNGCATCAGVEWSLRSSEVNLTVPPGAAVGTTLTLAGQGDHRSGTAEDLIVEIVVEGERAVHLRNDQARREQLLEDEWDAERVRRNREWDRARNQVRARRWGWLLLAGGVVTMGFVVFQFFLAGASVGERCTSNEACTSKRCLTLKSAGMTMSIGGGNFAITEETGKVCTRECTSDGDCPGTMHCEGITEGVSLFLVGPSAPEETNARACVPAQQSSERRR